MQIFLSFAFFCRLTLFVNILQEKIFYIFFYVLLLTELQSYKITKLQSSRAIE